MTSARNLLEIVATIVAGVRGAIAVAWWWVGSAVDEAFRKPDTHGRVR